MLKNSKIKKKTKRKQFIFVRPPNENKIERFYILLLFSFCIFSCSMKHFGTVNREGIKIWCYRQIPEILFRFLDMDYKEEKEKKV